MSWPVLAASPLRAVVFYELLGLTRARAHQSWSQACAWIRSHGATDDCRPGLSPHAPYSVRAALFRAAANLSSQQKIPLAIHLAETPDELDLLRLHSGRFVDFLSRLGAWEPQGLAGSPEAVVHLAEKADRVLFAHCNYQTPAMTLTPKSTIVYCPRTHAAFGHTRYPLDAFIAAGNRVALGTDSLASNPDLSMLAEARDVRRQYPDMAGADILRMATLAGAEALGWEGVTGSLAEGKSADLVVIPLSAENTADPHEAVLDGPQPVQAVMCKGRWVFQAPC